MVSRVIVWYGIPDNILHIMHSKNKQSGFTLIELLVVVAIIGLLASIVMISIGGSRERSRIAAALRFEQNISHGLEPMGSWGFDNSAIADGSGLGNNGTFENGATIACGANDTVLKQGCSLSLDGVDDYVSISDSPSLNISGPLTIDVWIKLDTVGVWRYILIKDSETFLGKFHTYQLAVKSDNKILFALGDGVNPYWGLTSASTIEANVWHHIAAVYDGNQQLLYIDGMLNASSGAIGNRTLYTHNFPLKVGILGRVGLFMYPFDGQIDEVHVYDRALTSSAIQQYYVDGIGKHNIAKR